MKKVICVETGIIFDSSARAGRWLGVTRQSVNNQLRGTAKSCAGFHFEYYEKKERENET